MPRTLATRVARLRIVAAACVLAGLSACDRAPAPVAAAKSAAVEHPVTEASLTTVTLSPDAERRLAIAVDTAARRALSAMRTLPGEVVAAPGLAQQLAAPVAGRIARPDGAALPPSGARVRAGDALLALLPIATDRDVARSKEELDVTEARLRQAQLESDRVEALWRDRLVSARDREATQAALAVAQAARDAAAGRAALASGERATPAGVAPLVIRAPFDGVVRALNVGDGQLVAAGASLVEVVQLASVWIRVPAYVGDLARLQTGTRVTVQSLGAVGEASAQGVLTATPVAAPPTADPASASADLFYQVANTAARLRPGQRVQVNIPMRGTSADRLVVPWAAVVFDHDGGSWVYERTGERTYARRRVALGEVVGDWAEVRSGVAAGTPVVTAGAAELLGIEFGPGK